MNPLDNPLLDTKRPLLNDRQITILARQCGMPKAMYDTEGWRSMLAIFAQRVRQYDAIHWR